MKKIIAYSFISADKPRDIAVSMANLISEGWQPLGGMVFHSDLNFQDGTEASAGFIQTIVKYEH